VRVNAYFLELVELSRRASLPTDCTVCHCPFLLGQELAPSAPLPEELGGEELTVHAECAGKPVDPLPSKEDLDRARKILREKIEAIEARLKYGDSLN